MTINEIAQLAGVSRATVSRYLNDGYVSEEKKKRIAKVIAQTGYVPSQQARTLRTGKTSPPRSPISRPSASRARWTASS